MLSASQWVSLNNVYFCGGLAGPSGFQGKQGASGPTGPTGPNGINNSVGSSGSQGSSGISSSGVEGIPGSSGPVGLQGIGSPGIGSIGSTGPSGQTGYLGPTGPTGPTGQNVPTTQFITSDLVINGNGNGTAAVNTSPTFVYAFNNFLENNSIHQGYYKFIAYVYVNTNNANVGTDSAYRQSAGPLNNAIIYDFVIFPTFNGIVSYIPIQYGCGTSSMQLANNSLNVGFIARVDALSGYLYRWEIRKLSVAF